MGAVSSIFAVVQEPPAPSLPAQTDATFSPQASAPTTTGATQQDIVTLAGRATEGQQSRAGNENDQFGEAASFFFAEKQSFRAGNGSGGSQTAQAPSVPQLPVKIVKEPALGQQAPAAQNQANAANGKNPSALAADSSETQQTNPSSGTTEDADTPLAELAQLDDTLQQMGINPQSISLFNRMAMVLYANDPAALRVLVQTLQSGTQHAPSETNASESQNAASLLPSASEQSRLPTASVDGSGSKSQVDAVDGGQSATDSAAGATVQGESDAANPAINAPNVGSAATPRGAGPNPQARPPALSIRLEELNSAFAAIGTQQASVASGSANGQFLNVTF